MSHRIVVTLTETFYISFSGPTRTQIHRFMYMKWYGCLLYPIIACFTKRPIEGVQSILFCVLDESLDDITGGYYRDCNPIAPSSKSLNVQDCQRLWELSEKLLGLRSTTTEVLWKQFYNWFCTKMQLYLHGPLFLIISTHTDKQTFLFYMHRLGSQLCEVLHLGVPGSIPARGNPQWMTTNSAPKKWTQICKAYIN